MEARAEKRREEPGSPSGEEEGGAQDAAGWKPERRRRGRSPEPEELRGGSPSGEEEEGETQKLRVEARTAVKRRAKPVQDPWRATFGQNEREHDVPGRTR